MRAGWHPRVLRTAEQSPKAPMAPARLCPTGHFCPGHQTCPRGIRGDAVVGADHGAGTAPAHSLCGLGEVIFTATASPVQQGEQALRCALLAFCFY